jgi:hypothetical protein
MLVLTSPDGTKGVMLAVPMEETVYIYRVAYNSESQLLLITFDFGLTQHSNAYPSMATFSCLLFPLAVPSWGMRAGLQQYYDRYPLVWGEDRRIRDQG